MTGFLLIALLVFMCGALALGITSLAAYWLRVLGWSPKAKRERIIEQMRVDVLPWQPTSPEEAPPMAGLQAGMWCSVCQARVPQDWSDGRWSVTHVHVGRIDSRSQTE